MRQTNYQIKSILQEVNNTIMIGRYVNGLAQPIDGSSNNIIFEIEPLCEEPYALTRVNYEQQLLPSEVIYHGIDRADHYEDAFPPYYDFHSHNMSEKEAAINRFYQDSLVLFHPSIRASKITNNYFRNLEVIDVIPTNNLDIPYNYYTLPRVDMDQAIFEQKLFQQDYFELEHYSSKLYQSLNFVVCGKTLYVSEYLPHGNADQDLAWCSVNQTIEKYDLKQLDGLDYIVSKQNPYVCFLSEEGYVTLQSTQATSSTSESELPRELDEIANESMDVLEHEKKAMQSFMNNVKKANLCYRPMDLLNFHICMKSSPLVIVAGRSGTGKTRITFEYAKLLDVNENNQNLLFFPISPALREPAELTGYYNPQTNHYIPTEGGLVDFLVRAQQQPERMHMVIFDEMNLAQIEHYFAQFLSVMEKDENKRVLPLYNASLQPENKDLYPHSIKIGKNVLFVGTVNLDETTSSLSDRLLDRCFVVNLTQQSFQEYCQEQEAFTWDEQGQVLIPSSDLYRKMVVTNKIQTMPKAVISLLDETNQLLHAADRQKGVSFRTLKNIGNYLANAENLTEFGLTQGEILDFAFQQTIVKKISGDAVALRKVLGDEQTRGSLFALLESYPELSDFTTSMSELQYKKETMNLYGYTARS